MGTSLWYWKLSALRWDRGGGGCLNLQLRRVTSFSPGGQPSLAVFLPLIVFMIAILSELLKLHSGHGAGGSGEWGQGDAPRDGAGVGPRLLL